jgi:hypothetical protein
VACILGISGARAAKEALLIANADYSHFGKLPNPIPDARQLADVLRQIGFNVNLVEDASREGMLDALGNFEERLKASKGIAFFHYGGHGVQVDGKNFLIPADADIPDEKRVATRAVDVDEVMGALDASGSSVNVVVLDACRDNPLPATSTRSAMRGLSVVARKPKNSIIVYAAEADNRAIDGLFTPVLARTIAASSNKDISDVMKLVRREVYERSQGAQTPGEYNQLFSEVVLDAQNVAPPLPAFGFAAIPPQTLGAQSGPVQTKMQPQDFVRNYYALLARGDYEAAWQMLPASLQSNPKIHPDGYQSFRSWLQQIQPIKVTAVEVLDESADSATVSLSYACRVGGRPRSFDLHYVLLWDPVRTGWKIASVRQK